MNQKRLKMKMIQVAVKRKKENLPIDTCNVKKKELKMMSQL